MIKAVLFDMDGVLINSVPFHDKAYTLFFKNHGSKFTKKDWHRVLGFSTRETMEILLKEKKINFSIEKAAKEKGDLARSLMRKKSYFFPDAEKTVRKLENYKIGLVTSASDKTLKAGFYNNKRFLSLFKIKITSNDVKKSKPNPDCYLLAAKKLKVKPIECVVVEDSLIGVHSAKAAGMKCIAITNTFPRNKLKRAGADFIVGKISQVLGIVERIRAGHKV